jgi:SlyX protein
MVSMSEQQIINLEIKFAHLEDFTRQLNEVVTLQQSTIARMEKEILDLKRNVNSEGGVQGSRSLQDDKPPHY